MKKHSHFFVPCLWTRDPYLNPSRCSLSPGAEKGTPVLGYNEEDLTSEFQTTRPCCHHRLQKFWQSSLHVVKQHSPGLHNVSIIIHLWWLYIYVLDPSWFILKQRLQMVPGLGLTRPHWDNSYFSLEKGLLGCLLACFFFLINCWFVYPTVKLQPTFPSITTQHTPLQPNHLYLRRCALTLILA